MKVHKLGVKVPTEKSRVGACPRCNEKDFKYEANPHRAIKLAPETNVYEIGDEVLETCNFCGWWSRRVYTGSGWKYTTSPKLSSSQRNKLNDRIEKTKAKRRAIGGKGR